MKLLIVEDDANVRNYIAKGMREAGHAIDTAHNGKDGLHLAQEEHYDVIILDRMLPELSGIEVLEQLRGSGNATKILILSALADIDDKVEGLRAGGDDYMVKPFAFAELLARVEVLGRRTRSGGETTELTVQDLHMDLLGRKVTRGGEDITLQTREFRLLEYLLKHKEQVITRTMLLEAVWEYHFDPQTNVIDVHMSRLRKKINDREGKLIQTVRGAGYIVREIVG